MPDRSAGRPGLLRELLDAALGAADPALVVAAHLPDPPRGRTVAVGAGKAAAAMAQAVEQNWRGPLGALSGLVVTRYGYARPCERIEVVEAAHPVPDEAGPRAARRILTSVSGLGPDDLVLALLSGGGSALLTLPAPGLDLADVRTVSAALLRAGAPIGELNLVRRHLSAVAGGRLAAAARPARVHALLISDVPGDDPAVIASGPTAADSSDPGDAQAVLDRYRVDVPAAVRAHLAHPSSAPAPGDLEHVTNVLVATPSRSLDAAADAVRAAGMTPVLLGDAVEGESRDVAVEQAALVRRVQRDRRPAAPPCVLLSGGETTVRVRGNGTGGPNAEFALALALELSGAEDVWAIACDTDGVDGAADVAGAVIGPDTLARAEQANIDARAALEDNDAHTFFGALGDSVVTGPTFTNVNDFRAVLVG